MSANAAPAVCQGLDSFNTRTPASYTRNTYDVMGLVVGPAVLSLFHFYTLKESAQRASRTHTRGWIPRTRHDRGGIRLECIIRAVALLQTDVGFASV